MTEEKTFHSIRNYVFVHLYYSQQQALDKLQYATSLSVSIFFYTELFTTKWTSKFAEITGRLLDVFAFTENLLCLDCKRLVQVEIVIKYRSNWFEQKHSILGCSVAKHSSLILIIESDHLATACTSLLKLTSNLRCFICEKFKWFANKTLNFIQNQFTVSTNSVLFKAFSVWITSKMF